MTLSIHYSMVSQIMNLNDEQLDRAIGVVLASAAGDALGAPYEFKSPISLATPVEMKGGGSFNWAPGEWTDDTSMAIPILQALASGKSLADESTQDEIVAAWQQWAATANDVGVQTRAVLAGLKAPTAASARDSAESVHRLTGRSGGNGSLMRTAPVALGTLESREQTATNARAISRLTHLDEDAGDACVLWSDTIRTAILTGNCEIRDALELIPDARRSLWLERIEAAEKFEPSHFENNGWVVSAFQAAWSAGFRAESLADGLERAVRAGNDTDTVAAIAGGVLGAKFGASQIPRAWTELLHGWPGLRAKELEVFVRRIEAEEVEDDFMKAYRRLYVAFSSANDLEIDVDWYEWTREHEEEFDKLYRKLQGVYCRRPL
jgi:ADP-ribosyl-[dinitrogen reductase] hydrolase